MKKIYSLILLCFLAFSGFGQTVPLVVFSYGTGYFGNSGSSSSGNLDALVGFSTYNIKNCYFTNVTNGATSNNLIATAVFELSNGSDITVPGLIYARHTVGGVLVGLLWKPNLGTSTNVNGYTVSNAADGSTSNGICVQLIGQTISLSGNGSNQPYYVSGNSGNLTISVIQAYTNTYPNVFTNTPPTSFNSTSVTWGGYIGAAASPITFTSAGIAYSPQTYTGAVANPISVDPSNGSQTKTVMVNTSTTPSSNTQYNFSGTTNSLLPNTTYYYRAYVVSGGQTYQGPQESFTTCPAAPPASPTSICTGSTATVTATGISGGTLTWYTSSTGGTAVSTGASFTTGTLTNNTSSMSTVIYYVQDANSSCPSTRTQVNISVKPLTSINTTCNSVYTFAKGSTSTITPSVTQSGTGSYTWYSNATNSTSGGSTVAGFNGVTNTSFNVPTATSGIYYYYFSLNDGCGTKTSPVTEVVVYDRIWNGSSSTDWATPANWTANGVPSSTDVLVIPSNGITNFPTFSSLTIGSGGAIVVLDQAKLTSTATLTNDGTLMVNSGATFVYTGTTPFAGSGNYIFKQNLTGSNVLYSGTYQPSGRYWYMGVPFDQARSVFGIDPTSTATDGPLSCKVWEWNEAAAGGSNWTNTLSSAATMTPTKGYLVRTGATCKTVQYSIAGSTGTPYTSNLTANVTRQSGAGLLSGFNLVSNPYPAYIDAGDLSASSSSGVAGQSSNIATTIWIRTVNPAGTAMVYDHFLATSPAASIINSNANNNASTQAQLRHMAPYQAFWVRVNSGQASGTVSFPRTSMEHFPTGTGLRTFHDYRGFVRMNLVKGDKSDQMVVYLDDNISNGVDKMDAEKFFVSGVPQMYTKSGNYKLAINGINAAVGKTQVPVSVEIPSPSVYIIDFVDFQIQNGKVYLEDKKLGLFIDLDMATSYQFFSVSGTIHDRFVLHFNRHVSTANPSIVDGLDFSAEDYLADVTVKCMANQGVEVTRPVESTATGSIHIYDNTGREVIVQSLTEQSTFIPITFGAGIYLVSVELNGKITTKKVLIN